MPSLHLGVLDSEGKHIARTKVRLVGVGPANIGSQSIDTTLETGFDGVASFNFGDFANGAIQIHADVTTPKGKTASKDITDAVAPVVRPDINHDITVASDEGNWWTDLIAKLGEHKNEVLVGGAVLAGVGLYLSERKRQREEAKRQQELMMMFALRAPQETAQTALQNGGALEKKKKALPSPQAKFVKLVRKAVKK